MARKQYTPLALGVKQLLGQDQDLLRPLVQGLVQGLVQEVLEAEMDECLQAGKHERTARRLGYRSGYYERCLITRVGKLELRVPQDRESRFSTEVFESYQRRGKALVAAITEQLCGHGFSASSVSRVVKKLDAQLEQFAQRPLEEAYPYPIVDARYEKVREDGVLRCAAARCWWRSGSTTMGGAACWGWSWRTGRPR